MIFEKQITNLCEEAAACKSETEAIELAQRARNLMHARVDELRSNLNTLQQVAPNEIIKPTE
jgi:hypothetical protein